VTIIPPKLDAGNETPRMLRQHAREIASWARVANDKLSEIDGLVTGFVALETTSATPLRLTADAATATAINIGPVVDSSAGNRARFVRIEVVAERTGGASGAAGDAATWVLEGLLTRSTTALAGGGSSLAPTRSSGGGSAYRLDILADTTLAALTINAIGVATTTIQWRARIAAL
jgi:hypothetical protein